MTRLWWALALALVVFGCDDGDSGGPSTGEDGGTPVDMAGGEDGDKPDPDMEEPNPDEGTDGPVIDPDMGSDGPIVDPDGPDPDAGDGPVVEPDSGADEGPDGPDMPDESVDMVEADMAPDPDDGVLPDVGPDMAEIQPDMAEIQLDMGELQPDMAELQPDMAELQPDMAELQPDMAELQPDMAELQPDMAVEPENCQNDNQCADNEFCAGDGVCILGCRVPDNCGPGQWCNANRSCVNGCRDDAQCIDENGADWACERRRCEGPCANHGECDDGEFCDDGRCEDGCGADDFEDNNGRADAAELPIAGNGYDSGNGYLSICEFDVDWYVFRQPVEGSTLTVAVEFDHDGGDGDLDIRLHPPESNALRGDSANDDEVVEVEDAEAGEWHLEIFGRGFAEARYSIGIEIEVPAGACIGDAADPGDDEAGDGVYLDLPELQSSRTIRDRRICEGDEDWYAFDLGDGDGVEIQIAMTDLDGGFFDGLDFAVFGPGVPDPGDFATMLPDSFDDGPPVTIGFSAPRNNLLVVEGRYYLQVLGLDADFTAEYDVTVTVDRVALACADDPAEPNDARGDAENLMDRNGFTRVALDGVRELRAATDLDRPGLTLCEGDEDWFRFELRAGDDIDVRMARTGQVRGVMVVEITDADGNQVGQAGQNAAAVNVARLDDADGGTYYVHIRAPDEETKSSYDLRLNRTAGFIACGDDDFDAADRNDARADATSIDPGDFGDLTLCGADGDIDWYVIEVDAVSDIDVSIDFEHDDANLDVDIFRDDSLAAENGDEQQGHSNNDGERVFLGNRLPGTYTIAVRSADGGTAGYDMEVRIIERAFVCEDDDDEDNESIEDATPIGGDPIVRNGQWLCDRVPAESDYFELSVPPNTARTVVTTFTFGDDGDLFLELYNAQGALRASTNLIARVNSKQCIRIRSGDGNDTFYLRVAPLNINRIIDDDERLDYTIHIADGDVCDDIGPPTPGVNWPRVNR